MMHDFHYVQGELFCEKAAVRSIVKKIGTPVYIYSHKTLVDHIQKIEKAFHSVRPLICYSMKANSSLAVVKTVVRAGAGLDIVSGGELYRAQKAGCPGEKIVFAGVGKTREEIAEAVRYGIFLFNVESEAELEAVSEVAARLRKKVQVSLRVNPAVDPHTHQHIATGKAESKFGLDLETAKRLFAKAPHFPFLKFSAIHVHIGSQIVTGKPFVEAFWKVLHFIDEIEKVGVKIEYLNLGGGLGVIYDDEKPQTAEEFARNILPLFRGRKFRLIFEPGRFVSANAGILVTRVLYLKQTQLKNFVIVDAAMNDLIRPALYGAHHAVCPVRTKPGAPKWVYDIVGPVCESGDVFAKDRHLEELAADDLIALMSAGAYGFVMSSNYNSRPRAPEVLVKGSRFAVVRKRETRESLLTGESIPPFV